VFLYGFFGGVKLKVIKRITSGARLCAAIS
jgi:hypothetical protein